MKKHDFALLIVGVLLVEVALADIHLDQVELPPGFSIEIYAEGVENARQMALGEAGTLFVTQHGSWNRTEKIGYQVLVLDVQPDGKVLDKKVFASGWLQGQEVWGRPNDVLVMPDGALLVSDDLAGVIYRISYSQ